jgi:hypothetical protein
MNLAKPISLKTVLLLAVASLPTQAQFWEKKDFSQWTLQECTFLLYNQTSPWVSSSGVGRMYYRDATSDSQLPSEGLFLEYKATVVSARTMQQALARLVELGGRGKKPSRSERDALAGELERTFSSTVVFRVGYQGSRGFATATTGFWKGRPQEELMRAVTLVSDGMRIPAIKVEVEPSSGEGSGGFQVVFPRLLDGKAVLTHATKEFHIEIVDPNTTVRLPFDVKKMKVRGELVY